MNIGSPWVRYGLQKISYQQIKIQVFPTFLEKKGGFGNTRPTFLHGNNFLLSSVGAPCYHTLLIALFTYKAACLDHGSILVSEHWGNYFMTTHTSILSAILRISLCGLPWAELPWVQVPNLCSWDPFGKIPLVQTYYLSYWKQSFALPQPNHTFVFCQGQSSGICSPPKP